jgi:hypothetical protein
MKSDIYLSEVVESRETPAGVVEVCASAEGKYESAGSVLEVKLDAHVQNIAGEKARPAWLPKGETVREHVAHEEIREIGRDMFQRWVKRVRAATPQEVPMTADGKPALA